MTVSPPLDPPRGTATPAVSTYVPCFNNAATLARVIRSIQEQTTPVAEILVIDDGSTDASAAIARSLGARLISHPVNLGRGAARARAMLEVEHDLVLCCDGTKPLHEAFVERALHWFEHENVAAVFGALIQAEPTSVAHRWRGRHLFKDSSGFSGVSSDCLATWGSLVRKSSVLDVGNFDSRLRENEDGDLGARLRAHGYDLISDRDLLIFEEATDSVARVLERHWRWKCWNAGRGEDRSWTGYFRSVVNSVVGMAREDLLARDLRSVPISLLSPHYRFWRSRRRPSQANAERQHPGPAAGPG